MIVGKISYDARLPIWAKWTYHTTDDGDVDAFGYWGAALWSPNSEKAKLFLSSIREKWTIAESITKNDSLADSLDPPCPQDTGTV